MAQPPGIDISRWQGEIDWEQLKQSKVAFACIRASIGDFFTDDKFAKNWQGAKETEIFRCAYHVLRPDITAVAQISHFESVVGEAGDLPHVLDVELTGNQPDSVIQDRTFESLQEMEARFGRKPLVYTADWFWTPHIGDQPWVEDYDLWVAHYYWPQVQTPKIPAGWMVWKIWQHSNRGRISGVPGNVDLNWFGGTMEDLIAYAGETQPPQPPTPDLEKRVENLERWAMELDAWARAQGYDGIDPED
jgi:lysozyme